MSLSVILVGGIPGTGVPEALGVLLRWIEATPGLESSVWQETSKFEVLLVDQYNSGSPVSIKDITPLLEEPKPILRDLWEQTLGRLKEELNSLEQGGARYALVPIHLVWYHQRLREYISVLNPNKLRARLEPHVISQVLCLIDDIHDIYARLRQPGKLYHRRLALEPDKARRGHAILRHLRILDWRAREILAGEAIADALDVRFTVLATKHHPSVAFHVLTEATQVYLSHPIREIRSMESSKATRMQEKARDLKNFIWTLQSRLATRFAFFQPTSIDEYRLELSSPKVALARRFFPHQRYSDSLFSSQGCRGDDVFYDDLRADEEWVPTEVESAVSAELGHTIQSFIENQVTARDLRLVAQSNFLVVFRPRFNGSLSSGVKEEISYFDLLSQFDSRKYRRVLLLDSKEDEHIFAPRQFLEEMVAASEGQRWRVPLCKGELVDYLDNISDGTVSQINRMAERTATDQEVENAIDCVLGDLGLEHERDWTIGTSGETTPLGHAHTFAHGTSRITEFCESFRRRLRSFDQRPPYVHCEKIWIDDNKTLEELVMAIEANLVDQESA